MRSKKDLIYQDTNELEDRRKRIYQVKDKYSVSLTAKKNGKTIEYGKLNSGDAVYISNVGKSGKTPLLYFKALKFANTPNQETVFSANAAYFEKYKGFENSSNADGSNNDDEKRNYGAVVLSALGVGVLGFFLAKRFEQSKLWFSVGGVLIGGTIGLIATSKPKLDDLAQKAVDIIGKNRSLTAAQKDKIKNDLNNLEDRQKEVAYDYVNKKMMLMDDLINEKRQKVADEKMKQLENTFNKRYGKDEMDKLKKIING